MYYLQSRYYDPEVGRFVNGDEATYLGVSGNVLGYNLFSYCENNAVNHRDLLGNSLSKATIMIHYQDNCKVVKNNWKTFTIGKIIYRQDLNVVKELRMGKIPSKETGSYNACGWIATYNALCHLGFSVNPADIILYFELNGLLADGLLGVMPAAVKNYFNSSMFSVKTIYNLSTLSTELEKSGIAILWCRNKGKLTYHFLQHFGMQKIKILGCITLLPRQ